MSEPRFILGIDLGGTHVKGLVVDEWGRVHAEDTRPTEDGAAGAWRDNVRRVAAGLQGASRRLRSRGCVRRGWRRAMRK